MKTKKYVHVETDIEMEYDPESEDFKNALESYKAIIDDNGDEDDMLRQIAGQVMRWGVDELIEGVGYVHVNGVSKVPDGENWCGVNITGPGIDINGYPEFETDYPEDL